MVSKLTTVNSCSLFLLRSIIRFFSRGLAKKKRKTQLHSIFENATSRGYVTALAHTSCQVEVFEWHSYLPNRMSKHDHRMVFCDPNFINANDPFTPTKGEPCWFNFIVPTT